MLNSGCCGPNHSVRSYVLSSPHSGQTSTTSQPSVFISSTGYLRVYFRFVGSHFSSRETLVLRMYLVLDGTLPVANGSQVPFGWAASAPRYTLLSHWWLQAQCSTPRSALHKAFCMEQHPQILVAGGGFEPPRGFRPLAAYETADIGLSSRSRIKNFIFVGQPRIELDPPRLQRGARTT